MTDQPNPQDLPPQPAQPKTYYFYSAAMAATLAMIPKDFLPDSLGVLGAAHCVPMAAQITDGTGAKKIIFYTRMSESPDLNPRNLDEFVAATVDPAKGESFVQVRGTNGRLNQIVPGITEMSIHIAQLLFGLEHKLVSLDRKIIMRQRPIFENPIPTKEYGSLSIGGMLDKQNFSQAIPLKLDLARLERLFKGQSVSGNLPSKPTFQPYLYGKDANQRGGK